MSQKTTKMYEWLDDLETMNPAKSRFFFLSDKNIKYCLFLRWKYQSPWEAFLIRLGDADSDIDPSDVTTEKMSLPRDYCFTELGIVKRDCLQMLNYYFHEHLPEERIVDQGGIMEAMWNGDRTVHAMTLEDFRTFKELYLNNPNEGMFTEEKDHDMYVDIGNGILRPIIGIRLEDNVDYHSTEKFVIVTVQPTVRSTDHKYGTDKGEDIISNPNTEPNGIIKDGYIDDLPF